MNFFVLQRSSDNTGNDYISIPKEIKDKFIDHFDSSTAEISLGSDIPVHCFIASRATRNYKNNYTQESGFPLIKKTRGSGFYSSFSRYLVRLKHRLSTRLNLKSDWQLIL